MRTIAALLLLLALFLPSPAYASHGLVTGPDCGTHEFHGEADMTKGRTDGIVYSVDHRVGCKRYIMSNLSPAGIGEAQGNEGQIARCIRYGKDDTVALFDRYFHTAVNPDDVQVRCSPYSGPD